MNVLGWVLGGALAASLAVHGWCWSRCGASGGCGGGSAAASCCTPGIPGGGEEICLDGLALTAEQRERIEACCASGCCGVEAGETAIRAAAAKLQAALAAPTVDAALVRSLAAELGALRERHAIDCAESVLLVRGILTPEQTAHLQQCAGCTPEKRE